MKKTRLIALVSMCVLSIMMLTACGSSGKGASSADAAPAETTSTSAETQVVATPDSTAADSGDNEIIIDPPYVVVDDDNLKMTVTSICCTDMTNMKSYQVHYTVENKLSDFEVETSVGVDDASIGQYTVQFSNTQNTTKAGKINDTGYFSCSVSDDSTLASRGSEHITKLEDLLDFEADVMITIQKNTGSSIETHDRYLVKLSLSSR